jgi:hypothetical protein
LVKSVAVWACEEYGGRFRNATHQKGATMLDPDLALKVPVTPLDGYTPHEREELESVINAARLGRETVETEDQRD